MSKAQQVAVITGAARRIGAAVAQHLHARGFDIALHYHRSSGAALALAARLNAERPDSCQLFAADLTCSEELASLAADLLQRYAAIDLLVNNASGFAATPIESSTPADFDAMLGSNLRAPYFLIQSLLPGLGSGASIVNMLDVHIARPLPRFNAYGAAKAGLAALTRSLAVELAPEVRVNGVAPGAILWPEDGAGGADGGSEKDGAYSAAARERTVAQTPLQRLGEPLDIARAVFFLAREAPFITGQVITVDGGRSLTD